jgi:hypothetical protein
MRSFRACYKSRISENTLSFVDDLVIPHPNRTVLMCRAVVENLLLRISKNWGYGTTYIDFCVISPVVNFYLSINAVFPGFNLWPKICVALSGVLYS